MKAHKIEILVIDPENMGVEEFNIILEQNRFINGRVLKSTTYKIGEWSDEHPLNKGKKETLKWLEDYE